MTDIAEPRHERGDVGVGHRRVVPALAETARVRQHVVEPSLPPRRVRTVWSQPRPVLDVRLSPNESLRERGRYFKQNIVSGLACLVRKESRQFLRVR
jgi:hypothetical protein